MGAFFVSANLLSCSTEKTETPKKNIAGKSSNIINPLTADFSKPIDIALLTESMQIYFQKEMILKVYPITYMDSEPFVNELGCASEAGSEEKQIYITFKTIPQKEYKKNTAYLIKCKIGSISAFDELNLIDAELIGEADEKEVSSFNPESISSTLIYSPKDIFDNIMAWGGKRVTVQGNYSGTTTSKALDGRILEIRVDLASSTNGDILVGCAFVEDPGNQVLTPGALNVKISGELDARFHFDRPYLTNCKLL